MQKAPPHSKLNSRYQIHETVGSGGAGEVCTAWDTQLERTVAIKRIRKDGLHEDVVKNTWQEAIRLATVRHANIVTVYDMGVDDGTPYIVMEYVNGETVEERIAQRGAMDQTEFIDLAHQTLEGLLAAHHAGLLHRDLKPSNLMLTRLPSGNVQVKILDFGIARFLSSPTGHSDQEGTVTGSIHCIAPEILNSDPVDERSDLYSIGCVFYYALTGHFPFDGEKMSAVIAAHLDHMVIPLHERRPDLPPALCDWIMALINRWPDHRYASTMHALSGLHVVLTPPTLTPEPSLVETADPTNLPMQMSALPVHRDPWKWPALAVALLCVAGGGAWLATTHFGAGHHPDPSRPVADGPAPAAEPHLAANMAPAMPATPATPPPIPAPVEAAPVVVAATPAPAPATPPPAEIVLRFHGSNTIGAQLLPALLEKFLEKEGGTAVKRDPRQDREEVAIEAKFTGKPGPQAVEVAAHGSKTAFEDLAAMKCDVGIASRPIKPEEAQACARAGLGDLQSASCEHVLGLDGIAMLVSRNNPIEILSVSQIADIFSGRITDWVAVGGKPGPIHLFARDAKSGTFDTFKSLVLGAASLSSDAQRLEDSDELSAKVSQDPQAIGFAGLPFVHSAKLLAVSEDGAAPLLATRFTVATEDYALSRRLYVYTPERPTHPWVARFVEFALGPEGQEIVSKIGFIKQTIDLERPAPPLGAPPAYLTASQKAERLSVNLRFKKGSVELDNKSLRDLTRINQLLEEPRANGRRLLLFGFADNVGAAASNLKISKERAQAVARQMEMRGIEPALVTSFGSSLPVANNETESGRDKNRRVEVWLR